MAVPPRLFISYSHDSPAHKQWVLKLALDLRKNGIDAAIDQWDLSPGDDIPTYMEQGLKAAERVVVVCSAKYVERANDGKGGVGYEKMIVTAELIENLGTKKFIPIIRGSGNPPVPTFLGYRLYIDFEDDAKYMSSLETLLRELLHAPDPAKPPVGPNPFSSDGSGDIETTAEGLDLSPTASGPLDPEVAPPKDDVSAIVATMKALFTQPSHALELNDLIMPVANDARSKIEESDVVNFAPHPSKDELVRRIVTMDQATNKLAHLFAVGCHWADTKKARTFSKALSRVAIVPSPKGTFFETWETVARYAALRVMYAGGVAACANDSFDVLAQLLLETKSRVRYQEAEAPLVAVLHHRAGFAKDYWKWLPGRERHFLPVSDYLEESLRSTFTSQEIASDDEEVSMIFDKFEFFQALIYGDLTYSESSSHWAPLGTFIWRRRDLFERTRKEIKDRGKDWKPLLAGLFSASPQRATEIVNQLEEFVGRVRSQLGIW
jgi:hypothetical protein